MRTGFAAVLAAGLLVGPCGGGGQTEATEAEEALANDVQPAAPSPGTVVPSGAEGNVANEASAMPQAGNGQ